jgi:hypothetical protein
MTLDDPPTNANNVLCPPDTETGAAEATAIDEDESNNSPALADAKKELFSIMDMSTTDNDGLEIVDDAEAISIVDLTQEKNVLARRGKPQEEEHSSSGENKRSRSRPTAPPASATPAPSARPQRHLRGQRSDPTTITDYRSKTKPRTTRRPQGMRGADS